MAGITGLGITDNFQIAEVAPDEIVAFAIRALGPLAAGGTIDLVFASCTNFGAMAVRPAIAERLGLPVVTSNQAVLAAAVARLRAFQVDDGRPRLRVRSRRQLRRGGAPAGRQRREEAKILAGGQSLMPMLNLRLAHPELLIDINPADQRPPSLHREPAPAARPDPAPGPARARTGPPALPAARRGGPARRQRAGPQPRHDRRQPGPRRPDLRDRLLRAGHRGPGRGARSGRMASTHGSGQRAVRRLLVHHPRSRGDHHRRPDPGRPAAPGLVVSGDGPSHF